MINQITQSPFIVVVRSLIPGLPIWQSGKRRQVLWIWIALVLAIVLLILFPSLLTWYLVCVVYLGQMVYSVWLSIWLRPENKTKEFHLNANLSTPLPVVFQQAKKMDQAVFDAVAREIRPDPRLVTAILGFDRQSERYQFYCVTENDLVIADCTDKGTIRNIRRIPIDQVAWVTLLIGERNCLMTISYEEERFPSVTLQIPGKLKNSAKSFINEFPATWEEYNPSKEIFLSIHKLEWSPQVLITGLISFCFVAFGLSPANGDLAISLVKLAAFTLGFFLPAWSLIIWLLQKIKKEPAFTCGNFMRAFFVLPAITLLWWMAVTPLGMTVVNAVQLFFNSG